MLADTDTPTVLAGAPAAVMLADACNPAVLALAPLAIMLASAGAQAVQRKCRDDSSDMRSAKRAALCLLSDLRVAVAPSARGLVLIGRD
jgi:hypothetical protein